MGVPRGSNARSQRGPAGWCRLGFTECRQDGADNDAMCEIARDAVSPSSIALERDRNICRMVASDAAALKSLTTDFVCGPGERITGFTNVDPPIDQRIWQQAFAASDRG